MQDPLNIRSRLKETKRRSSIMLAATLLVVCVVIVLLSSDYIEGLVERLSLGGTVVLALAIFGLFWIGERWFMKFVSEPIRRLKCSNCSLELARVLDLSSMARQKHEIAFCPSCGTDFRELKEG